MIGRLKTWMTGAARSLTVWTSLALIAAPDALAYVLANWPALTPFIPPAMQSRVMNVIGLAMFLLRIKTVQSLARKGAKAGTPLLLLACLTLTGCSQTVTDASAQAAGDVVTWSNPSQRTDLTPFTTQADTLILWGKAGGPYADGSAAVPFPGTTYTTTGTYTGTRCYVAIARDTPVTDPVTKAVTQLVSSNSNEVCKTVTAVPKPPAGLAVK